jgi:Na+-driven multidrug efflux pump
MAANQSLLSVESISFLSADGFGVAAAALVAQKLGAGRPADAQRAAWIAARYAVVLLTAFGLTALALRDLILPLFSVDPAVAAISRSTIPLLALAQPFMATSMVLAQSLRGAGRTRDVLGVTVTGALVVRLAATWVFAFVLGLGLVGVWMGSTTDWALRTAALSVLVRRKMAPPVAAEPAAQR